MKQSEFLLSVIIPGLNEEFMQDTVTNVLENSSDKTEVICILDGYWPKVGIKSHPRLRIIHNQNPLGQRGATNQGARLSEAKFIMKLDAHCAVSKGFDEELMNTCKYDWIMIPRMYSLDAFHWCCLKCEKEFQQGPVMTSCEKCGSKNIIRKIIWEKKDRKKTDYMWISNNDNCLRMKYFDRPGLEPYGENIRDLKKRCSHKIKPWSEGLITDVMTCIGAGWFLHRDFYWSIDGMDEAHGSWGQMAVELSMKAWLSGGRMVVNKNCWFAHLSRTQKGFGFPYKHKPGAISQARNYSNDLWLNNKWSKAIHTYDWLIKKFSPLPGWEKEQEGTWDIEPPMIHMPYPETKASQEPKSPKIKSKGDLTKGVVYYTDNRCEERISSIVRMQLNRCCSDMQMISISQFPITLGENFVVDWPRSTLTMFKQILYGLEELRTDIAFLAEHDVIYHPDHFNFNPPRDDIYYFDDNIWKVDAKTGKAIYYITGKSSQLCANRDLLIDHYKKKIKLIEKIGYNNKIGYEPGNRSIKRGGVDDFKRDYFHSEHPNIDIRHATNLTPARFKKDQFRKEPKGWIESDEVPFWGKTLGRFDEVLNDIMKGTYGH